jgi:hypothetical protein
MHTGECLLDPIAKFDGFQAIHDGQSVASVPNA